ncbi:MAG: hypothetical protein B9S36_05820 [Verrucomicrobiia bacterium Tous-C2TDCM]|nr:MAG: hypothetical protein B9S36_05820 [Verrucomicrobiae bacterium Tous-C2TDCM]
MIIPFTWIASASAVPAAAELPIGRGIEMDPVAQVRTAPREILTELENTLRDRAALLGGSSLAGDDFAPGRSADGARCGLAPASGER